MTTLLLKKFDIKTFQTDLAQNIFIIGRRETGRSVLIRDLLYNYQKKDNTHGTIITQPYEKKNYSESIPNSSILEQYEPSILENVLKSLKPPVSNSFLVLDNCMYDTSWTRDKFMRMIIINGRICKLMLIMSMSYPLGIPPLIKTNFDYVFLFIEKNMSNKKRIWENYTFDIFSSFEMFCTVFDNAIMEEYNILVIKNTKEQCEFCDKIFWYKAEIHNFFT